MKKRLAGLLTCPGLRRLPVGKTNSGRGIAVSFLQDSQQRVLSGIHTRFPLSFIGEMPPKNQTRDKVSAKISPSQIHFVFFFIFFQQKKTGTYIFGIQATVCHTIKLYKTFLSLKISFQRIKMQIFPYKNLFYLHIQKKKYSFTQKFSCCMKRTFSRYLLLIMVFVGAIALSSCSSSQFRNYKRYVKRKNTALGYRSHYQKKLKRTTMPINKNYIIRNKRTSPSWR